MTIRHHLQRAQCIALTATCIRFLLHPPFLCVHLLSLNSLFPFNASFFPPLVPLSSFRYLVSVPMFFLLFFIFIFLSFSFCRICFSTPKEMQNFRVSHFLLLHVFEARLGPTDSNRLFVRRKIRSGGHDWGNFCSLAPDTKCNDVRCTKILPLWEQTPWPNAPWEFTVPTANTTNNLTSRYMTKIHTHVLLIMLVAARSKECIVYRFLAEGSCVRIPLGKWLCICFFDRSCCPGHKPIPLSELQQYK